MDADRTEAVISEVGGWTPTRLRVVSERILAGPPLFDVEAAGSCNVHCDFCPRLEMARPAQVMSPETFDAVLALLPDDAVVMFSGLGDALTNRRLESFLRALHRRGISSCVVTNGLLLTPERQASLIEAGIAQIQVSYHATSREAYEGIVVRGGDMDRLHENLEHLSRTRPASVRARLNFVETPENASELDSARRYAESLGFDFFFRRLHSRGGSILSRRAMSGCAGCGIFAAVTFVTAQGDVLSCINDVSGASRLGNVRDLAWRDVVRWKRDVIEHARWFPACVGCDDDYRWIILKHGSVELPEGV